MSSDGSAVGEAVRLQEGGHATPAEALYRIAVENDPADIDAAFRLGVLLMHAGRNVEAVAAYQRVLAHDPRHASTHANLGAVLQALGRSGEAEQHYREAIAVNPILPAPHLNLGALLQGLGRTTEAEASFRAALRIDPEDATALLRLATLLLARDAAADALPLLRRLAAREPENSQVDFLTGAAHLMLRQPVEAIGPLTRAAAREPDRVAAPLARALVAAGESVRALPWFERAAALTPNDTALAADLLMARGCALQAEFRHEDAIAAFDTALAARPGNAPVYANRAASLTALGRVNDARLAYERAIEAAPDNADIRFHYGMLLQSMGRFDEARAALRRAAELRPGLAAVDAQLINTQLKLCDWRGLDGLIARLVANTRTELAAGRRTSTPPFGLTGTGAPFDVQMGSIRAEAVAIAASVAALKQGLPFTYAPRTGKLRVGYLSPDFRSHSVARLFRGLLEAHDRSKVELFAYSLCAEKSQDQDTAWFRRTFDHFRDFARTSHADAARAINADGIHVLVDLASHTKGARPEILALEPAPVQVHTLGYNLPLGAEWCRYLIADTVSFADPALRDLVPADLAMIDGPWAAIPPPPSDALPMTRAEAGLPRSGTVFAQFNAPQKLEPVLWGAWMRTLAAVPNSVLWMLESGDTVRRNLAREAASYGVDFARIVWAPAVPHADHVRRLGCADIAFDTYYYKGGATALEMLAAGVPVITLSGPGPAFGASLVVGAGTPETAAASVADYERISTELGRSPERIAELKRHLIAARSGAPLFDTARWARSMEDAYERMWEAVAAN